MVLERHASASERACGLDKGTEVPKTNYLRFSGTVLNERANKHLSIPRNVGYCPKCPYLIDPLRVARAVCYTVFHGVRRTQTSGNGANPFITLLGFDLLDELHNQGSLMA